MKNSLPPTRNAEPAVTVLAEHRLRTAIDEQLEAVFRAHRADLFRFLKLRLRSDADAHDALQIVFVRLLQRGAKLHEDNLVSLAYVSARNVAIDLIRQRATAAIDKTVELVNTEVGDERPGPERELQGEQRLKLLMMLVNELPRKCRAAFVAYKLEEQEYAEIARKMGVTESMVRKYVIKAIAYCAARFERLEGWE